MKKLLSLTLVSLLVLPIAARGQGTLKIGTVDMNRTFREYNKTKDAEAKINDAKNQAKKEYDERADAYKKALDDINNLNKQLEAPALSADAKAQKARTWSARSPSFGRLANVSFRNRRCVCARASSKKLATSSWTK